MKILIADASDRLRADFRTLAEKMGHRVVGETKTGDEAVRLYLETKPDLLTLDVEIERLDCIKVITEVRHANPTAKVGLMATAISVRHMLEARKAGACDFILKPIKKDKLKDFLYRIELIKSAA